MAAKKSKYATKGGAHIYGQRYYTWCEAVASGDPRRIDAADAAWRERHYIKDYPQSFIKTLQDRMMKDRWRPE